jgi:hypothetical protein
MAYIPENTEVGEVTKPDIATIDRYQIHMIHIDVDPDDIAKTRITVDWSKGFLDGSGKYVAVRRYNVMFKGGKLLARLGQPTTGLNVYAEVQKAAWELLHEDGWLPNGEIV